MRTTLRLDDGLYQDAKKAALDAGTTVTVFLEEAVREKLARKRVSKTPSRLRLPVLKGSRLQAGIDLDSMAALLSVMEEDADRPSRR